MANNDLYRETNFDLDAAAARPIAYHGSRTFSDTRDDLAAAHLLTRITAGTMVQDFSGMSMDKRVTVRFATTDEALRDYWLKEWLPGKPSFPKPTTAKVEFETDELVFLSVAINHFLGQVKDTMPGIKLPSVATDVQRKLNAFVKEMT